jgi:hypothetical protein
MLSRDEASDLIDRQVKIVKTEWTSVCNTAELAQGERDRLWESAVLNPFCLEDWS